MDFNLENLSPREFKVKYEEDNKIYNIVLSNKKDDKLIVKIFQINSFPLESYENEFSKEDLDKITTYFRMFENIDDLFPELIDKIEKKEYKIIVKDDLLLLHFCINIRNVQNPMLPIKKLNISLPSTVDSLCEVVNKILEDNAKLKKEINELRSEVLILKEEKEKRDKKEKEKEEIINKNFKDSSIITNYEDKCMILNWIRPNVSIKLELLYKVSRDGDRTSIFFQKVSGKTPTLLIVKTTGGYKFGGFTSREWIMNNNYYSDNSAFIFSINNRKKYEIKSGNSSNAIYGCSGYIAFGGGHDFIIYDDCTRKNNPSNFGHTYNNASNNELMGGSNSFTVKEFEVYHVIF
jgi:hypothetical protein